MRYVILFLGVLFLGSCGGDSSQEVIIVPSFNETQNDSIRDTSTQVNVFLDVSQKMKGFFQGNSSFKNTLSDLHTFLSLQENNKLIADVNYFFVHNNATVPVASGDFINLITTPQKISWGTNINLAQTLDSITQSSSDSVVNILISDYTLAYAPDAPQIKGDVEANKNNIKFLANQVSVSLSKLPKNGVSTMLHAFQSDFQGAYTTYKFIKKRKRKRINSTDSIPKYKYYTVYLPVLDNKCCANPRPFYIGYFGNEQILKPIDNKLKDIESYQPLENAKFGFQFKNKLNYNFLISSLKEGKFLVSKDGKALKNVSLRSDSIQFAVAVNLTDYPEQVTQIDYVRKYSDVIAENVSGEVVAVHEAKSLKLKSQKDIELLKDMTHVFVIKLHTFNGRDESSFRLALNRDEVAWYEAWSTMDDTEAELRKEKTFAFQHLVSGIQSSYNETNSYFDMTFDIKTK